MFDALYTPGQILRLLRRVAVDVQHGLRHLHEMREQIMADFTSLHAALDRHDQAVTGAVERVNADVADLKAEIARLSLDDGDQQRVDEVVARVEASVGQLNAIDPVRPQVNETLPADGGTVEPTDPAANPNA